MGLFFTLLYILTAYLSPAVLFGPLAEFRIELFIAFLALVTSLPSIQSSGLLRTPQTYAVIGMCGAVIFSLVFTGWIGGAPDALLTFLPNAITFFLVYLNFKKKLHLQLIVAVLLFVGLFVISNGVVALHSGDLRSPYLVGQDNDQGQNIVRLRGMASINDPNDFAQFAASLIPCLFFFWRKKSGLTNALLVYIPAAILIYGMYLTHSRGGMVALLAVVVFAARRKLGLVRSLIIGGVFGAITMAVGWSGGRDVSVEAGADRMEAWSVGLGLIKSHPIFGVGFQQFGEHFIITAHNTVVVCAAELGLVGLLFWVLFTLTTIRDTVVMGKAGNGMNPAPADDANTTPYEHLFTREAAAARHEEFAAVSTGVGDTHATLFARKRITFADPDPPSAENEQEHDHQSQEELRRMARVLAACLTGFLVAGWFLSRAYIMTLFIYGGISQVLYRMALDERIVPPRMPMLRALRLAAYWTVGLIALVYLILRLQHLMPN